MFMITLCYPEGHPGNGATEAVRSDYVPQIGMEISGSSMRYGTYRVVRVNGSTDGSTLSDHVYVYLEESD
jgi:hypothetical protein